MDKILEKVAHAEDTEKALDAETGTYRDNVPACPLEQRLPLKEMPLAPKAPPYVVKK